MANLYIFPVCAALLMLAACDHAKSPEQVASDTNKAEHKADAAMQKSEQSVNKDLDKAAGNVVDEVVNFNNDAARDAYKLAVTQADGDRKIALAKCEAQSGDAQKNCKDVADANYKAAKADAKAAATAAKQ